MVGILARTSKSCVRRLEADLALCLKTGSFPRRACARPLAPYPFPFPVSRPAHLAGTGEGVAWRQEHALAPLFRPHSGASHPGNSRPPQAGVGNVVTEARLRPARAAILPGRRETLSDWTPKCGAGEKPEGGASRHFARPEAGAGG